MTDVDSFAVLEPTQDGFRNFLGHELVRPGPETLVNKANLIGLSAPEMTALVVDMRVLGTTVGHRQLRLTNHPGTLTIAEVYASEDGREKFVQDFVSAWVKVMDSTDWISPVDLRVFLL
ncbi:MAG: hypothetical protein AAF514_12330 [Verrucomicrobiota bacterium]